MAVLFAWNQRPRDKLSYDSLRLATELPDAELRRTLLVHKMAHVAVSEVYSGKYNHIRILGSEITYRWGYSRTCVDGPYSLYHH